MTETLNSLDRVQYLENLWIQLYLSITMDAISLASSILDYIGVGILMNAIIAPIQTSYIYAMIGEEPHAKPFMLMAFVEEMIPVFWLPSCTLAWYYKMR